MLAHQLRILILSQLVFSLALGWYWHSAWPALLVLSGPAWFAALSLAISAAYTGPDRSPRLVHWLQAWWGETLAIYRSFYWLQAHWSGLWNARESLSTLHTSQAPLRQSTGIVLVHGYTCSAHLWQPLREQLLAEGYDVVSISLEPIFASIDLYAGQIDAAISQHFPPDQKLILIGHSMGGLCIRAWLRDAGHDRTLGVITLGTPHHGTALASWSQTPNGLQMRQSSPWLQALSQHESADSYKRFSIAYTLQDNIVFPQAQQTLPGARVQEFSGIGHLQMVYTPAVQHWVLAEVAGYTQQP